MASENLTEITDQNFEQEVLKSGVPVLVDFWAEWCMPCRMLAPTIEKLAKDYAGKVKVGKLDTDANRDVSIKYSISAIPTVILFKDGQVAQKFVGLRQERDFKEALDALLVSQESAFGRRVVQPEPEKDEPMPVHPAPHHMERVFASRQDVNRLLHNLGERYERGAAKVVVHNPDNDTDYVKDAEHY